MTQNYDISQMLQATQNNETHAAAENELKRLEEQNINAFLYALADELRNEKKHPTARNVAGNLLKSSLSHSNPVQQQLRANRWGSFTPEFRDQIKTLSYEGMCSVVAEVAHSAARVIAAIAVIELPFHYWDGLLPKLLENMKTNNLLLKETTLRCLGYICQDLPPSIVMDYTNPILTTVMNGMRLQENEEIVLAATTALYNCLQACSSNFANVEERKILMEMIRTTCQCGVTRIRIKSMECLVEVATVYYKYLKPFMEWIFQVTTTCIAAEAKDEDAQKMAIEFWTSVAEHEIAVAEEREDARQEEADRADVTRKSREQIEQELSERYVDLHITVDAAPIIAPYLWQVLLKKDDSFIPDEWGVVMAACYLLSCFAKVLGDKAIDLLMPFVSENFISPTKMLRDAAVTLFGLILDGPSTAKIEPLVKACYVSILKYMNTDPEWVVRDSASFTMMKMCECDSLHDLIKNQDGVMKTMIEGIYLGLASEHTYVSKNCCTMLESVCNMVKKKDQSTNALSPYFDLLYDRLLSLSVRKDADENDLRTTSIGTLTTLIECSADQHQQSLLASLDKIVLQMKAINDAATAPSQPGAPPIVLSHDQKRETDQRLAEYLSIIGVTATRVGVSTSSKAQGIFYMLYPMINTLEFSVHEEILQCLQKMAAGIGRLFYNYFNPFEKYVVVALKNFDQPQLIVAALQLLSDVVQGAEKYFAPSLQTFAPTILQMLQSPNFPMKCRGEALTTLNDFALLTGDNFIPYLNDYMTVCHLIMSVKLDPQWSKEERDNVISMRNTMIEGLDCVLSGLYHDHKHNEFNKYFEMTLAFLVNVIGEINSTEQQKEQGKQNPNFNPSQITPTLNDSHTPHKLVDLLVDIATFFGYQSLRTGMVGIIIEFLQRVMERLDQKKEKERKKTLRDLIAALKGK